MLTAVKNQLKVTVLSIKYGLMREMLNKTTFVTNILFMILNNATMIIQWIVLYSLKDNIGGYSFKEIILLWGLASGTYGVAHFCFEQAFNLSEIIYNGKLDSYLVQPKNVLISAITSQVHVSALGDIIYAYIMLFIYGITIKSFLLFTLFCICGGLITVSLIIIFSSLSFWFNRTDFLVDTVNRLMLNFATYPDGIFKGLSKIILYTIIPVGFANYLPVKVISNFNPLITITITLVTLFLITIAFLVFYKGLKRYSSSNLMIARI